MFMLKLSGQSHGITYQAVIINADAQEIPGVDINGNYMPEQPLVVRFTIQDETEVIEYQEEHITRTDAFGMINLTIGEGTVTGLSPVIFSEIEWDGTQKDLKVEISLGELAGEYTELSFQKLLFVPYAFHRNITATGTLMVDGATTLRNSLDVTNNSPTYLSGSLTVNQNSSLNGQVTITADVNGSDDKYTSYPLRVEGSNQGIGIRIDGSRNASNNYITFWDSDGIQGRIEGQTSDDLLSEPQYIFDQSLYAAQTIVQAANVAIAASAAILDPGNVAIEAANTAALIAEITAYNVFAFSNLGVTYESGAGDYAEWLPRLYPEENIDYGQIVGVYGGKISKETERSDMVMVVSKAPVILGNMPPDSIGESLCEKVGFMGQVPVWVIGKVDKGDFIIPYRSGSGFGKAVAPENLTIEMMGSVVGRAWSSADNKQVNLINTVIGIKSNEWVGFLKSNQEEIDSLKEEIRLLKSQIDRSSDILAQLVPGYKEAMENNTALLKDEPSDNQHEKSYGIDTKTIATAASSRLMTRATVLEGFVKAGQLLKAQGVDIDKNPFYSKLNSDSEYREKVIKQIMGAYNRQ